MAGNRDVSKLLKKIIPYEEMHRMLHEPISKVLLRNRDALLSLLPRVEPVVERDEDYYIYLCLLGISDVARWRVNEGEGVYRDILKCANIAYSKYDKGAVVEHIDSDISRLLHPKCPCSASLFSEKVIKGNIMRISDKSVEWLIDNYLYREYLADKRLEERIGASASLVDTLLRRTMKIGIYEEALLKGYYRVILNIYEKVYRSPLFDDFKKDFCEKRNIMVKKINDGDELSPLLRIGLLSGIPFHKKMNIDEIRWAKEALSKEKEIEYARRHGQEVSSYYNMTEHLRNKLRVMSLEKLLFELTHVLDSSSIFDKCSDIPFPYSVDSANEYFTRTRQTDILMKVEWSSSFYHAICGDPVLVNEYLSIEGSQVLYLRKNIEAFDDQLVEEILCMYSFVSYLLCYGGNFQCAYGACMNILAMTEKLLRVILCGHDCEKATKLNLRELLGEAEEVLGKNRSECLLFFVSNTNNSKYMQKFGLDYRNRLAHWTDIKMEEVNNVLVSELLFVFESVLNSVLLSHKYSYPTE